MSSRVCGSREKGFCGIGARGRRLLQSSSRQCVTAMGRNLRSRPALFGFRARLRALALNLKNRSGAYYLSNGTPSLSYNRFSGPQAALQASYGTGSQTNYKSSVGNMKPESGSFARETSNSQKLVREIAHVISSLLLNGGCGMGFASYVAAWSKSCGFGASLTDI